MALIIKRSKKEFSFYKSKCEARYRKQAAHDIRSPLSVINLLAETYCHLVPSEATYLMRSAVQRINDIANDMLESEKNSFFASLTNECLKGLVEEVLNEKIALHPHIEFNLKCDNRLKPHFKALVNKQQFQRALSNVLNNAIESVGEKPKITISIELKANHEFVEVICQDNGKGIPEDILERIGQVGVTHGKENTQSGSGLGVHQARTAIESIGGHFEISSVVNEGTCVSFLILR